MAASYWILVFFPEYLNIVIYPSGLNHHRGENSFSTNFLSVYQYSCTKCRVYTVIYILYINIYEDESKDKLREKNDEVRGKGYACLGMRRTLVLGGWLRDVKYVANESSWIETSH